MTVVSRPLAVDGADASIREAAVTGPEGHTPELFAGFEDYYNPRLRRLRRRYAIEEAVASETDEFQKILKLRHWVHCRWPIDNEQRFMGDAFAILERARTGAGFNCTHSMIVQQAVLSAFGFVARNLGVDRDHRDVGRSVHHGVNEVWSNDLAKWVLVDAKYDIHFERDGVPLSALEVHEAVRADGGCGVVKARGIGRVPVPMEERQGIEDTIRNYWWVSYHVRQDPFTHPHWSGGSRLVVLDNPAFRENRWYRQRREGLVEHWAYGAEAFIRTADRHQIEWTPGVPLLRARQESPRVLEVQIRSATPNFKEYRVQMDDRTWKSARDGRVRWRLREGRNTLAVRSRNLFGVEGPLVAATVVVGDG